MQSYISFILEHLWRCICLYEFDVISNERHIDDYDTEFVSWRKVIVCLA